MIGGWPSDGFRLHYVHWLHITLTLSDLEVSWTK
jgi:hypothetical protein